MSDYYNMTLTLFNTTFYSIAAPPVFQSTYTQTNTIELENTAGNFTQTVANLMISESLVDGKLSLNASTSSSTTALSSMSQTGASLTSALQSTSLRPSELAKTLLITQTTLEVVNSGTCDEYGCFDFDILEEKTIVWTSTYSPIKSSTLFSSADAVDELLGPMLTTPLKAIDPEQTNVDFSFNNLASLSNEEDSKVEVPVAEVVLPVEQTDNSQNDRSPITEASVHPEPENSISEATTYEGVGLTNIPSCVSFFAVGLIIILIK